MGRNALQVSRMSRPALQKELIRANTSLTNTRKGKSEERKGRGGDAIAQAGGTITGAYVAGVVEGISEVVGGESGVMIGKAITGTLGLATAVGGGLMARNNPRTMATVVGFGTGLGTSAANSAGRATVVQGIKMTMGVKGDNS